MRPPCMVKVIKKFYNPCWTSAFSKRTFKHCNTRAPTDQSRPDLLGPRSWCSPVFATSGEQKLDNERLRAQIREASSQLSGPAGLRAFEEGTRAEEVLFARLESLQGRLLRTQPRPWSPE